MRRGLILLLSLTGCAVPRPAADVPERNPIPDVAAAPLPPIGAELRVGVEFLPPAVELGPPPEAPRAEPLQPQGGDERQPTAAPRPRPRNDRDRTHLWMMRTEDLDAIDEPAARYTLRFVDDMLGEDRRRIKRELGTPILNPRYADLTGSHLRTHIDEEQAEEELEALNEQGLRLVRRPLRNLARQLPAVKALEMALEDFKADNVPLSKEYRQSHPDRRNLGRLSLRLRASDLNDPVEIAYSRYGVRVATGMENLKLGMVRWLDDDLAVEVNSTCNYETGDWAVRADLVWYANDHTSLRLVVGGDLDFLTTSSVYSLFESPMDGSPGLLLTAVHLF